MVLPCLTPVVTKNNVLSLNRGQWDTHRLKKLQLVVVAYFIHYQNLN